MERIVWPSDLGQKTVPIAVEELAQRQPDKLFLHDATGPEVVRYTFGAIRDSMYRSAAVLRAHGVSRNDTVAVLAPNGAFLLGCVLGTQMCGAAPVVIYPPGGSHGDEEYRVQLLEQLRLAEAKVLVVGREYSEAGFVPEPGAGEALQFVLHEETFSAQSAGDPGPLPDDPAAIAHLQFTSGSTGRKRGVMLTHQNLIDNTHALALGCRMGEEDRMVSWLPLAHDMGLVCGALMPLLKGFPLWLARPSHFIQRPVTWLRALSEFRGTMTAAPNFAYQRCVKTIRPADCEGLDLSSLKVAICAAEPIVQSTIDTFYERFRHHGLRDGVLFPGYGLAENTVAATVWTVGQRAHFKTVDYETIVTEQRLAAPSPDRPSIAVCSVGYPVAGVEVSIVDDAGQPLPEERIGEIVIRGRMVGLGYRGDPEASAQTFRDGALHTGDYGFLSGGELFITGRKKDIIIHAGRNYYPQDFEGAVIFIEGVSQAAAFGLFLEASGTEGIVLLVGTHLAGEQERQALITACRKAILASLAVSVDEVLLVPPHLIPKTTSGKIRRSECRRIYRELKESSHGDRKNPPTTP